MIEVEVLQRNALFHDMDSNNPRQLALEWILNQDKMQPDDVNLYQRYILAVVAFSLDSISWINCGNHTSSDNSGKEYAVDSCSVSGVEHSVWLSGNDECTWYGVTCGEGIVLGLELSEF